MWFMFGFLTLSICIIGSYIARQSANWKPDKRESEYEYKLNVKKGEVTGFLFGVIGVHDYSFIIKHETWYDRLFKKFKVSNEVQTGDAKFDDLVYVISDNTIVHEKLIGSIAIRNAIKTIFYFGGSATVEKLECRNGRLWIKCSTNNQVSELNINKLIAKPLLSEFFAIAKDLNQLKTEDYNRWTDPFVYKSLVVLGISTGLAVNAVIQLFRTWLGDFPFLVSTTTVIWHSIFAGIVLTTILVLFSVWWLKNSSRTHMVLIEIITIGLLGAIGTFFHELRDANIEWKQKAPEIFTTELVDYYITETRRFRRGKRTHYHLVFRDWNCECDQNFHKEVSYPIYRRLNGYKYHRVTQYKGALGYPWVSKIELHK